MKTIKSSDIIFLTRRKNKKPFYRWFVSNAIAKLSKFKEQSVDNAKVHAAIIFDRNGVLLVREMESNGNVIIPLEVYVKTFNGRIEIISMPDITNPHALKNFNEACLTTKVKYDYANLLIWQLIRAISNKWLGTNTPYKRDCIEDVSRMYNIINPIFLNVEKTNPNEAYKFIKEYIN